MPVRSVFSARQCVLAAVAISFIVIGSSPCRSADSWTTLTGRLVFSGNLTKPDRLEITRDEDVCGDLGLTDESLIVDPKNRGLRNVAVWLYTRKDIEVHPSYDAAAAKPVVLDNRDCRFEPRFLRVRTGQMMHSTNADPIAHNVAVYGNLNTPFSTVLPRDQPLETVFQREERVPIRVDCSIHAWMRAYLVITKHPYSAVTDRNGNFRIENVPSGTWEFRFWHERPGYIAGFTTDDGAVELKRGVWELDLSGDARDLGELKVDGKLFEKKR